MAIKADCGNTCSEELNTMLAIAMLVLLIALKSLFSLVLTMPGVLVCMGKRYIVTFPLIVIPGIGCLTSHIWHLCHASIFRVGETSGIQKGQY